MAAKPALSFGFAKKAEPKRVVASLAEANKKKEPVKEVITSVDELGVQLSEPQKQPHLLTIPCKNPLALKEKPKATPAVATATPAPKLNLEAADAPAGLVTTDNLAKLSAEDAEAAREILGDAAKETDGVAAAPVAPILMRAGSKKARDILTSGNAPEASRDMFERVPVASFGEAMLRGMGYDPAKNTTKPIIRDKIRDGCLGLGAKELLPHEKAIIKGKKGAKGAGKRALPPVTDATAAKPEAKAEEAADASAPDAKQRRTSSEAGAAATSVDVKEFWPCRALVVRVISKTGQLVDAYGTDAVVLEADEASLSCRIKARINDVSRIFEGVSVADLEPRVSRDTVRVRFIRGARKGTVGQLVRRDAQKCTAIVCLGGDKDEIEVPLEEVSGFMGKG